MKAKASLKQTKMEMVPKDWEEKQISDVCRIIREPFSPTGDNEKPYVGLEHIQQGTLTLTGIGKSSEVISNKFIFRKGQVLFGKLRPYFKKVIRASFDGVCSTDIWVIDAKEGYDNRFIFYFFATQDIIDEATNSSEGTKMPRASWDYLSKLKRQFPPFNEQIAIAEILLSLDNRIAINHQMNITLKKIGQALFKHWFRDFEFPNEKGKPYKSSGGEMVYIEDIGQELPKGWKKGLVLDLVDHSKDTISPYDSSDKIFFHYSIPSYDEGKWPSMEKGNLIKSNKFLVKSNSILVSKLNPRMPRVWAVGEVDESCSVCSTEFQVLVPKKKWNYNYVYFSFNSGEITDEMKSLVTGTSSSHQRVRPEDMLNLKIAIPPEGVLQKFEDISFCLRQKMWQMDIENKYLCSIRDSFLPKLMSGKIRVGMAK